MQINYILLQYAKQNIIFKLNCEMFFLLKFNFLAYQIVNLCNTKAQANLHRLRRVLERARGSIVHVEKTVLESKQAYAVLDHVIEGPVAWVERCCLI